MGSIEKGSNKKYNFCCNFLQHTDKITTTFTTTISNSSAVLHYYYYWNFLPGNCQVVIVICQFFHKLQPKINYVCVQKTELSLTFWYTCTLPGCFQQLCCYEHSKKGMEEEWEMRTRARFISALHVTYLHKKLTYNPVLVLTINGNKKNMVWQ